MTDDDESPESGTRPTTETCARAREPGIVHQGLTESRIEIIAQRMRALTWVRGKTGPELAREWGVSKRTLEGLAGEASRRVRAELTDLDGAHVDILGALRRVVSEGFETGDLKAVVHASKTYAQVVGAMAPTKIAVREEPPEKLTDEQLEALAREAVEALRRKRGS